MPLGRTGWTGKRCELGRAEGHRLPTSCVEARKRGEKTLRALRVSASDLKRELRCQLEDARPDSLGLHRQLLQVICVGREHAGAKGVLVVLHGCEVRAVGDVEAFEDQPQTRALGEWDV